jgi:hypothetical protein
VETNVANFEWGKFKLGKVYFRKKKVKEGNCFVGGT